MRCMIKVTGHSRADNALMQITSNILASAVVYTAIKVWNITSVQLIRNQNNPELYATSGVIDYGTKIKKSKNFTYWACSQVSPSIKKTWNIHHKIQGYTAIQPD